MKKDVTLSFIAITEALSRHNAGTSLNVAAWSNLSIGTVRVNLHRLSKMGYVRKGRNTGVGNAAVWHFIKLFEPPKDDNGNPGDWKEHYDVFNSIVRMGRC